MRTYRTEKEKNKLFFTNYERIDDEIVFNQIVSILSENPLILIGQKKIGPLEDLYLCKLRHEHFELVFDINYGGLISSKSEMVINQLEKIINK